MYSRIFGQTLEGRRVAIKIEDCAYPNLVGMILHGRIYSLPPSSFTTGPAGTTKHGPGPLILELTPDSKKIANDIHWLLATPRWEGHAAYRLFIANIVVNLAKIDAPDCLPSARYVQGVGVGIAILKLE
jgi:hypothetical protein